MLFHAEIVRRDGKPVGYVRAGSYGHTLGGAVGLAMVDAGGPSMPAWLDEGRWEVDIAGRLYPAPSRCSAALRPEADMERVKAGRRGGGGGAGHPLSPLRGERVRVRGSPKGNPLREGPRNIARTSGRSLIGRSPLLPLTPTLSPSPSGSLWGGRPPLMARGRRGEGVPRPPLTRGCTRRGGWAPARA